MATIESIGSSTRIEGAKLSDAEGEDLLARSISTTSFRTWDEQEVAGYAAAMDLVFEAYPALTLTDLAAGGVDRRPCERFPGRGGAWPYHLGAAILARWMIGPRSPHAVSVGLAANRGDNLRKKCGD